MNAESNVAIDHRPLLSVVTGTFNEAENIGEFIDRVQAVFANIPSYRYEIIVIDNSSTDGTPALLRQMAAGNPQLKVILNARNFGHIRSPYHALLQASGVAVFFLASDLQDPPEMIPQFIEKWQAGAKVVAAVKESSVESAVFFLVRRCYYLLIERLTDDKVIQSFTGFGLYDKAIIDYCKQIDDPYPYFRGLIAEIGLPVARIPYRQPARKRGFTKNNFYTLYDLAILGITKHSKVPLRLATMSGFALSLLSLFAGLCYLLYKLLYWDRFSAGIAPVVIGLFLFCSVQLFFIGILGEYIGLILTHVRKLPLVVEKERINF